MCIRDSLRAGRGPRAARRTALSPAGAHPPLRRLLPAGVGGGSVARAIKTCLLYTSDAADDLLCVDLGGRRIIKKKKKK